jgi:hypothetical protein
MATRHIPWCLPKNPCSRTYYWMLHWTVFWCWTSLFTQTLSILPHLHYTQTTESRKILCYSKFFLPIGRYPCWLTPTLQSTQTSTLMTFHAHGKPSTPYVQSFALFLPAHKLQHVMSLRLITPSHYTVPNGQLLSFVSPMVISAWIHVFLLGWAPPQELMATSQMLGPTCCEPSVTNTSF